MDWAPIDTENAVRRTLGAPARPENEMFDLVPAAYDTRGRPTLYEYDFVSDAERLRRVELLHQTPVRSRIAAAAAEAHRIALRTPDAARRLMDRPHIWRDLRALNSARVVEFHCPHVLYPGESDHIEGWLCARGHRHGLFVEIVAGHAPLDPHETFGWDLGFVGPPDYWGDLTITVPAAGLTPRIVEEALLRVYMDRYADRIGHWAIREHRLPHIDMSALAWEWPEEAGARIPAEDRVAQIDAVLRDHQTPTPTERLFGRR